MRPELPSDYYEALGRVTAAAAVLEITLYEATCCLSGHPTALDLETLWSEISHGVLKEFGAAVERTSAIHLKPAARDLHKRASDALRERHEAVHSAIVLDPSTDQNWLAHHPKTGRETPIDAARVRELRDLARRMWFMCEQARRTAISAARHHAADSPRTAVGTE
ncbi:hypothetical protein CWIS_04890 [Cellulomonas sp. A375-1]|uniref:hypothetical protein n=1 Tax=Cellulomonas sp. A375-1 TaxID=1672219 RepID=UPI0006528233|nr:hypothetical protein [Cellulomonas sp. A375-1]KMM46480.1 hypothetical protein CWIS_04890 [Cellulomonas sp. A375-1]